MKGTVTFAVAMVAERLVSFFLLPLLTKTVSPQEYALWSQSIVISGALIPLVLLGFQTAIVKFYPQWEDDRQRQQSVLLFMLMMICSLLFIVGGVVWWQEQWLASILFGNASLAPFVELLYLLLVSEALFELLVGVLRAKGRIQQVSLYLLLKGGWRIGVMILVLLLLEGGFQQALTTFVLFQLIVTVGIYWREVEPGKLFRAGMQVARPNWSEIIRFSLPLVPLAALTAVNTFVDRFFLTHLHSLEMVAIYSAAFSLAAIAAFFYSVLGFTLFPELSRSWAKQNFEQVANLMQKVLIVYLALLIPFIAMLVVVGVDLLQWLSRESYLAPPLLLVLLAINIGLFGLYQISVYLYILHANSVKALIYMGGAVLVNVLMNTLLVSDFGMLGAAIAGLCSNGLLAAVFVVKSQQATRWKVPVDAAAWILFRTIVTAGVVWLLYHRLGQQAEHLILVIVVGGILYLGLDRLDRRYSLHAVLRPSST